MKFQKKEAEQPAVEPRVFYSAAANLCIQAKKPRSVIDPASGRPELIGGEQVQFAPLGSEGFGRYITSDPEVIEFLENHSMVFDHTEYMKRSTPADKRADIAEDENTRLITQNNTLLQRIAALEAQQAKS